MVRSFIKRIGFSSQVASTRSSGRTHRNPIDYQKELVTLNYFNEFVVEHGNDKVFNFDCPTTSGWETSFSQISRRIQTIVPKNIGSQPRIKQTQKGVGISIGCLIRSDGIKLPSILVAKGKTPRSLKKYGKYLKDSRCSFTVSPFR